MAGNTSAAAIISSPSVRSVPTNLTGVRDIAGNALDGEFYGYFPSGNNARGGDFIAELDAVHHTIFAPKTVIGKATPVSPPGTLPSNTTIPTHNPGESRPRRVARALKVAKKLSTAPSPRRSRPRRNELCTARLLSK